MENIQITSFDEAVTHLSDVVANVASSFAPQDQDDISQACWLAVFQFIKAKGAVDLALLIKCIPTAARRESKALNNFGFTPRRSKYKPPNLQWEIPDEPFHCEAESRLRDIELESTGAQKSILMAANKLLGTGRKPTQNAIAEVLGTTRGKVRYQLKKTRKKYDDRNKD